jgi:4-aminobutyrate--pyruvate transaminase
VQGAGGVIVPPATYFEKIQAVLRKYDVLLIADEVICGFGRTGRMFGTETFGLQPDIITVAKALSSAYVPISATVVSDRLYQAFLTQSDRIGQFAHGYTYSNHPVPAAVALETLKIYEERRIADHVQSLAPQFQAALRSFADRPFVGEVRGVGLIGAMELVTDKTTRVPFDRKLGVGAVVAKACQERGLIVRALGDTIAFCPPLIITEAEIRELFARYAAAFDAALPEIERIAAGLK